MEHFIFPRQSNLGAVIRREIGMEEKGMSVFTSVKVGKFIKEKVVLPAQQENLKVQILRATS